MSSLCQEKLLKIITSFSPEKPKNLFYPAGSFSSDQNSQETEEDPFQKFSNDEKL